MKTGVFNLDRSAKAIIAGAIAMAATIATGYDDGLLTSSEKALAVGAGLTALAGVWAFENIYAKAGIAAAVAICAAIATATEDSAVSAQEWVTIILAGLVALYSVLYGVVNKDTVVVENPPVSTRPPKSVR
jgi:hypothetical protein